MTCTPPRDKRFGAARGSGSPRENDTEQHKVVQWGALASDGNAVDVDLGFWTPRGPHSDARLRGDARGSYVGIRKELAAGMT